MPHAFFKASRVSSIFIRVDCCLSSRFGIAITHHYSSLCRKARSRWPHIRLLNQAQATFFSMTSNGDLRVKRKTSPVKVLDRPTKIFKPDNFDSTENGQLHSNDMYNEDSNAEDGAILPIAATADTAEWQATIEKVVRNVVSIHFCQTCSFDTDAAVSSEATGFVVDAKKGYILTNRHVVGAGPFWGYCIFDNHEEVV